MTIVGRWECVLLLNKGYARNQRMGVGPFQKIAKHFEVSDVIKIWKTTICIVSYHHFSL